jgi:hypothetical protein
VLLPTQTLGTPGLKGISSLSTLDCMLSTGINPSPREKFKTFSAINLELEGDRARGSHSNFKKYICSNYINQGVVKIG